MAERNFIEVMKEAITAIAPGLQNAGAEVSAELSRLGTQGAMEMAQVLFNGAAFTPYGPGQYTSEVEKSVPDQEVQKAEPQQERGGMEM